MDSGSLSTFASARHSRDLETEYALFEENDADSKAFDSSEEQQQQPTPWFPVGNRRDLFIGMYEYLRLRGVQGIIASYCMSSLTAWTCGAIPFFLVACVRWNHFLAACHDGEHAPCGTLSEYFTAPAWSSVSTLIVAVYMAVIAVYWVLQTYMFFTVNLPHTRLFAKFFHEVLQVYSYDLSYMTWGSLLQRLELAAPSFHELSPCQDSIYTDFSTLFYYSPQLRSRNAASQTRVKNEHFVSSQNLSELSTYDEAAMWLCQVQNFEVAAMAAGVLEPRVARNKCCCSRHRKHLNHETEASTRQQRQINDVLPHHQQYRRPFLVPWTAGLAFLLRPLVLHPILRELKAYLNSSATEIHAKKIELQARLTRRLRHVGIAACFLMPVVLFFGVVLLVFRYTRRLQTEPGAMLLQRRWTHGARLFFQSFNEPSLALSSRLMEATQLTHRFEEQFESMPCLQTLRRATFYCLSIGLTLCFGLALLNNDALFQMHLWGNHGRLYWLMTAMGIAWGGFFVKQKAEQHGSLQGTSQGRPRPQAPEELDQQRRAIFWNTAAELLKRLRWHVPGWRSRDGIQDLRRKLRRYFVSAFYDFCQEALVAVLFPWLALSVIPAMLPQYIEFFFLHAVHVEDFGVMCRWGLLLREVPSSWRSMLYGDVLYRKHTSTTVTMHTPLTPPGKTPGSDPGSEVGLSIDPQQHVIPISSFSLPPSPYDAYETASFREATLASRPSSRHAELPASRLPRNVTDEDEAAFHASLHGLRPCHGTEGEELDDMNCTQMSVAKFLSGGHEKKHGAS